MKANPWMAGRLRLASIEITRRCDNRCAYCEQPLEARDLPLTQSTALLDELAAEGFEAVALGGGEPTLYPNLISLLEEIRRRGLRAGLTTNARDPNQVTALADANLLHRFGVSAGKGAWQILAAHPRATVNLLLLRGGLPQVMAWTEEALRHHANSLLLLGYKGSCPAFVPTADELSTAFGLLAGLGRIAGVTVAADDYVRRRLGLSTVCGEGFLRVNLDGTRDDCCFPACEYRAKKA